MKLGALKNVSREKKKETKMALPFSSHYQSIFGFYRDQPVYETMFVHRDESGQVNLLSTSRKNLHTQKRLSSEWTNRGANEGSNKTYYTTDYRHVDNDKSFESGFEHASCEKVSKNEALTTLRNLSSTYSTSLQGIERAKKIVTMNKNVDLTTIDHCIVSRADDARRYELLRLQTPERAFELSYERTDNVLAVCEYSAIDDA